MKGKVNVLEAKVNTGGTVGAQLMETSEVVARITGGGSIYTKPVDRLDAKVTGGGTVYYRGEPASMKQKTLGGQVVKLAEGEKHNNH